MTAHEHPEPTYDQPFWEERYRSSAAIWSGNPNPVLVAETSDLPPGRALDVGSGEGADALWLAARGWRVTAADWSAVALARASAQATGLGPDIAARVQWQQQDLFTWAPPEASYDLVSSHFFQQPREQWPAFHARLAAAVAPGGTLLVVGHHPSDLAGLPRGPAHMLFTAADVAADLDPEQWDVLVLEERPRPGTDPEGRPITRADAVLRARKRWAS